MSDIAVSATESTSTSASDTASIAASVISEVEAGDAAGEVTASESVAATEPEKVKAAEKTPEVDPDDFDSVPAEETDVLGRKRENRIRHSRVKVMVEKGKQKVIGEIAKTLGITKAAAELKLEDVVGELSTRSTKFSEYETKFKDVDVVEQIMASDPERFIRMLATANPDGYGRFAKVLEQVVEAQAERAAPEGADDPEPQPDYPLMDAQGKVTGYTYSADGMRKLREWDRRQAKREIEAGLGERLKPIEDERKAKEKAENDRKRMEEINRQSSEAITKRLAKASKWPGWKDHEADILAAIKADPTLDIDDAYVQVVFPKMSADRNKVYQDVLADINKAPKTTSTGPASAAATKTDGAIKSTADIAREEIARLARA